MQTPRVDAVVNAEKATENCIDDLVKLARDLEIELSARSHVAAIGPHEPPMVYDPMKGMVKPGGDKLAWIEEEMKDGDRICEAAGVRRTEGGRLPVAKIINKLSPPSSTVTLLFTDEGVYVDTGARAEFGNVGLKVNDEQAKWLLALRRAQPSAIAAPQTWVPVAERMPEGDQSVFVSGINFRTDGRWREVVSAGWVRRNPHAITHWMELPSAPTDGSAEPKEKP